MSEKTIEEIKATLDAIGYDYDARLGKDNLLASLPDDVKAKLDETAPQTPEPPKKEAVKLVTCEVLRDYWPTDNQNDRVRKGKIVEVPVEAALDGVESGALKRIKG